MARMPALRRSLPVAAAVAALALVPSTGSAAPGSAPVQVTSARSFYASAEFVAPDGRQGRVGLGEFRYGLNGDWVGHLTFDVYAGGSGYATLTDAQVHFGRSLDQAVATDVPITLTIYRGGPDGISRSEVEATVSVTFTGTGLVDRNAYHGDRCGDGSPGCKGLRVDALRAADVRITVDGVASTGTGWMSRGFGIDVGTPETGGFQD